MKEQYDYHTTFSSTGYVSAKDACRLFGIPESSLRNWEKKETIDVIEADGLKTYAVKDLDEMYRTMKKRGQIDRLHPDWFYWAYEHPRYGKKIDTLAKYFNEFPHMEAVLFDIEKHKWSTTKFVYYDFVGIYRANSPLSHHLIKFESRPDNPNYQYFRPEERKLKISPLRIEVTFELESDSIKTDPYFITTSAGGVLIDE